MTEMLLEWVFTSIFLILVVLALRAALGRRVSAGLRYALWAVVLVRLLVPVQLFTSPIAGTWVHVEKRTEQISEDVWKTWPASGHDEDAILNTLGGQAGPSATFPDAPNAPALPDAPEPPEAPDLSNLPGWTGYLGWAWLAGSIAVAFVLLASNLRFYGRLRRERIPLDGVDRPLRVYVAVDLPSPCLFGLIRPAVYVTPEAAADPDMLRHVLAHECTHYKHGDHLWSLLRCAALAAHWWNPLVWLAARLSQRDGELACDEGALRRLGDGERAGYGSTLLALVTARPRPGDLFRCATTMAGDKKSLKERISRIASTPKRVVWAVVVAVLVTALACVCAFGQAGPEEDAPAPDPSPSAPAESLPPADQEALNLSFALDEHGDVGITGRVYDMELERGTCWHPAADSLHPISYLRMQYPAFTDGIVGFIEAWWGDDSRTSVMVTTAPTALLSSYMPTGYWTFTVDLSKEQAVVADMTAHAGEGPNGEEARMYPTSISDEAAVLAGRIAAKLLTAAEDYYRNSVQERQTLSQAPDLNRNGVPEELRVVSVDGGASEKLEVWENGELLFEEEGHFAHPGWNALFLYHNDGGDYLLRYNPYMGQGWCTYSYKLFTLENGQETAVRENSLEFDINFGSPMHEKYDAKAINAFMGEINPLLAQSVQLINTDDDLRETFEKEGRLYDSLWWLDNWAPTFVRAESKSLLNNLLAYQEAMEAQWYAETPEVFPVDELGTDIRLSYRDKQVRFSGPGWDYNFQPAEHVEPAVFDLNGDGRDEIVIILIYGHGTGCIEENLYVFDADTLEQYDTVDLNKKILAQVESTGDEDNFYLSAPWMERVVIPRSASQANPDAPMADALALGEVVQYTVADGQVLCRLGCDASGTTTNYIGHVNVPVRLAPSGRFQCGTGWYEACDPVW